MISFDSLLEAQTVVANLASNGGNANALGYRWTDEMISTELTT